ncbi:hypothetical protein D3C77_665530 [compost metagenome]
MNKYRISKYAGRTFKNAENVRVKEAEKTGIGTPTGGPIDSHSTMHSNVKVWEKHVEPILRR